MDMATVDLLEKVTVEKIEKLIHCYNLKKITWQNFVICCYYLCFPW